MKNIIPEVKNILEEINRRLETAYENIIKLDIKEIEIIQSRVEEYSLLRSFSWTTKSYLGVW